MRYAVSLLLLLPCLVTDVAADELAADGLSAVQPLLRKYCFECHSGDTTEADLDFDAFQSVASIRKDVQAWIRIRGMLDSRQMPPKDSSQPTADELELLTGWVRSFLKEEARATAGDPGPVVLRRLSNAEYTYSVRDLTGLTSLNPAEEFPIDGAAGEGFTNTGSGLVMSPALVQKYLDSGKEIAAHAALYPDGIRFTSETTRRDRSDAMLAGIQAFYDRYSVPKSADVNLFGGTAFQANEAGLLDIQSYLRVCVVEKARLLNPDDRAAIAQQYQISAPYLSRLWKVLNDPAPDSFLIVELQRRWRTSSPETVGELTQWVDAVRNQLWKFNVVGHVGRQGAPDRWRTPLTPRVERREFRVPLKVPDDGSDPVIHLSAENVAANGTGNYVLWRDLYLTKEGEPRIPLEKAVGIAARQTELRTSLLDNIEKYLNAASKVRDLSLVSEIARQHQLEPELLDTWIGLLGLELGGAAKVTGHFTQKLTSVDGKAFINGWGLPATPSVLANRSENQVRIPGYARPGGVVVHPSPTLFVAIAWQSPIDGIVEVSGKVSDAHPECGNGVEWILEHRSGDKTVVLHRQSVNQGGTSGIPKTSVAVSKGQVIALLVGPRDGSHACDLTAVDWNINETGGDQRVWNPNQTAATIESANPHADRFGNESVWHFISGPMTSVGKSPDRGGFIPAGSLLAKWKLASPEQRPRIAAELQALIRKGLPATEKQSPDGVLLRQLHRIQVPVDSPLFNDVPSDGRFGTHPLGHKIDPAHIVVEAPDNTSFSIPASLAEGRELTLAGMYDVGHGREGATRIHAGTSHAVPAQSPVVCRTGSKVSERVHKAYDHFRELFPVALCYRRIVPIDEVVTAVLHFRDDEPLQQLMLTEDERLELNKLWQEFRYVTQEPLQQLVAVEQIREFATQDRPDLVGPFDEMKKRLTAEAEQFRKYQQDTQAEHVRSLLSLAAVAWRRPLTETEQSDLRSLHSGLMMEGLTHTEAIRLLVGRVLTSPAFLYKLESPGQKTRSVSEIELATRLSYFLWCSLPDEQLRMAAEGGRLKSDKQIAEQLRRLLADSRVRRMAEHFACQWLHLRNFDRNDDKNEKLYPQFAQLRGGMYEETVLFFEDMIRANRSILEIVKADHTFVNGPLASHYGMENVAGDGFRRVNTASISRGGVLTMATFLASQSGASRTSPILRGNWISETLLGEKLPKPPANVPQLPERVPDGLTARQLIERHSSDPACAKCHDRIDPYGFTLEQFDAVGRVRKGAVNTVATVLDGTRITGVNGLQQYLLTERRDAVVRQFCRKLLGYALGREVQLSDEPLLDHMATELEQNDFHIHTAIRLVVLSPQFRNVRGRKQETNGRD